MGSQHIKIKINSDNTVSIIPKDNEGMFNIEATITKENYEGKDYNIFRGFKNGELTTIQSLSMDEIESLEKQLTDIILKLYLYRKMEGLIKNE